MSKAVTADREAYSTRSQGYYALFILCLIGVLNQLDRQVISIVLQPIKLEFHASDTEMGLLTGLIFAGFYALASLPIARLLDLKPRKAVLATCLVFWSLMTSLGGFTHSVFQLALTRIGLAAAEAGAAPANHSMAADLFKLGSRAQALAALGSAQSLGVGLGLFLGGWLTDTFSWRASFMIVGLPGLLLAVILITTVKEPVRGGSDGLRIQPAPIPLGVAIKTLLKIPSYRCILFGMSLNNFVGYGLYAWGPTLLIRMNHLSHTKVGFWFGVSVASSLILGNVIGGPLSDRLGRRDLRAHLWVGAAGALISIIPAVVFVSASDWRLAVGAVFVMELLLSTCNPGFYSMAQTLSPVRARATASVLMGLGSVVIGSGLAPIIIGGLSDLLHPQYGDLALRYAFAVIIAACAGTSVLGLLGARTLRHDYASRFDLKSQG